MLIAKGYAVSFKMVSGRRVIRAGPGSALLNDESGVAWPKCSGLVMPFAKHKQPLKNANAEAYLMVEPLRGAVNTPPKPLKLWQYVGEVEEVNYTRKALGRGAPYAGPYYHPIEAAGDGKARALLYKRGNAYRLELKDGCVWNWRGIVTP